MRSALPLLLAVLGAAHAQPLVVIPKTSQPPEMGTLHFLELRRDGHTYTIVPPRTGWQMKQDTSDARLRFSTTAGTANMTLRFTTNAAHEVLASSDTLRQHAAPELGEAVKVAELEIFSGNGAGKAADFTYTLLGAAMRCRVAALPVPGGTVDFVIHCGTEEFAAAEQTFGALINTFQRTSRTAGENTAATEKVIARRDARISGE